MKKFVLLLLAVVLAACSTPAAPTEQPVAAPPEPTATPVVIVQTVVVEATQVPTQPPPPEPVVVTVVVEPTQAAPAPQGPEPAQVVNDDNAPIMADNTLGAGWFVNMTRTGNNLSLRCQLYKQITFSVTPTDSNITQVDFYYRVQDKGTGAVFEWQNAGRMIPDANGNFTLVFSGEDIKADFRKPNAWFDYQFIGSSRLGGVVGRSEKIVQQVDYSNECPQ
ncbi:MAG: hypothetical protein C3F07_16855 [Anaerolineales bacterium]|nr:hypothetical protein [Anaerolineae bacterium]PWB70502.1 MAG: hypothetical protein C3F07_16855 [Anaerolineales bacterium]